MRIVIETAVGQPYEVVAQKFDQSLFLALAPPFPRLKLLRYDGNQPGNQVHVQLNFILFRLTWNSVITQYEASDGEIFFVDEGSQLPFFLKSWRHRHRILRHGTGSRIVDEITYATPGGWLTDWLMYPVLYGQFSYRRPIYRRYFR